MQIETDWRNNLFVLSFHSLVLARSYSFLFSPLRRHHHLVACFLRSFVRLSFSSTSWPFLFFLLSLSLSPSSTSCRRPSSSLFLYLLFSISLRFFCSFEHTNTEIDDDDDDALYDHFFFFSSVLFFLYT